MKAQANRYSLSVAPTGRARCRACKGLVARGEVRLVTLAVVSESAEKRLAVFSTGLYPPPAAPAVAKSATVWAPAAEYFAPTIADSPTN